MQINVLKETIFGGLVNHAYFFFQENMHHKVALMSVLNHKKILDYVITLISDFFCSWRFLQVTKRLYILKYLELFLNF